MQSDIHIPPEAVEAGADELREYFDTTHSRTFLADVTRAAILAAIEAWPVQFRDVDAKGRDVLMLVCPPPPKGEEQ